MSDVVPETISLATMRESLSSAVVCDALDALGYTNQSPNIELLPVTVDTVLVGRCRTRLPTSWSCGRSTGVGRMTC